MLTSSMELGPQVAIQSDYGTHRWWQPTSGFPLSYIAEPTGVPVVAAYKWLYIWVTLPSPQGAWWKQPTSGFTMCYMAKPSGGTIKVALQVADKNKYLEFLLTGALTLTVFHVLSIV